MKGTRLSFWIRAARGGLVAALFLLLAGDRGAQTAPIGGVDPLAILKLTIKNNVAIVLDTSGSMKWPVDIDNFSVGGDDPRSRLYQAKQAIKAVVDANLARLNFGLLTYNIPTNAKPLNVSQDFDDDDNDGNTGDTNFADGPFIYVSADANAAVFYNSQVCPTGGTVDGYFCAMNRTIGNYNGTNDADVFRSFGNRRGFPPPGAPASRLFSDPYCTPSGECFYYLQSRLFRSGNRYTWDLTPADIDSVLTGTAPIAGGCPLPPAGLTGDNPDADGDGFSDSPRPCIQFQDSVTGNVATFFYTSAIFQLSSGNACDGALTISAVAPCTADNSADILQAMAPELPVVNTDLLNGNLTANVAQDYMDRAGTNPTNDNPPGPIPSPVPSPLPSPQAGVRADQATPIAGSLIDILTAPAGSEVFPPNAVPSPAPPQKNYVIILSDGDDTCANPSPNDQDGDGDFDVDDRAIWAARQAEALFENTGDPQRQAETLFVAFASAINVGRSNKIAQAGSGGQVQPDGSVVCPPGSTCRLAFTAGTTDELIAVLNEALDQILGSGEFSAAPSILSTVFELGPLTDPLNQPPPPPIPADRVDSMNPTTRYNSRANILYVPSFSMPGFEGHLYAFQNDGSFQQVGSTFSGDYDAGEALFEIVSQVLEATAGVGGVVNAFTFAQLHGGKSVRDIAAASPPVIKRRIFTASPVAGSGGSAVNRTYSRTANDPDDWDGSVAQGTNVVAIWPPNQSGLDSGVSDIDPPVSTAGPLDDALGIGDGSDPVLDYDDLQSKFQACEVTANPDVDPALEGTAPPGCDFAADPILALEWARKEARQILLAWIAGAKLRLSGVDNLPLRETGTGDLIYRDRGWLLGTSTLGAPAIVGPPLRSTPSEHVREFLLFRDGRRDPINLQGIDEIDKGFGLRNPDFDDVDPETKADLKPVMTVVYHPANDMLHAFRAGPNCGPAPGQVFDPTTCTQSGAEELWGFMPLDQLGKIQSLLPGQLADPHTYVMASSARVADIFIPGTYTLGGVTFDGRWRTVLFVGRGPGGKFYTALDVTSPGPFTRLALDANPPFVMWNHGNEDPVAGVDPTSDDDYDGMGQSWSVPAVGNIDPAADDDGDGNPDGFEWRVWVGSGYGDTPSEGKTFYMLDAETGSVLYAKIVGDGTPTFIADNSLVASPSGYNAFQLDDPTQLNRSPDRLTRVYIPDIHGRIWKFNTTSGGSVVNEGPAQPFGVGVALLKLNDIPHIYAAAGGDERVPDDDPFKLFGYQDTKPETDVSTLLADLFELSMPGKIPGISEGFRGTVQPATAFSEGPNPPGGVFGRVFFAGTRFNQTTSNCVSTFDTILFGVGAVSGNAVYDFNNDASADLYTIVEGIRATNVSTAGGQVILGDSGGLGRPPGPPPSPGPMPSPGAAAPAQITTIDMKPGSAVCKVQ